MERAKVINYYLQKVNDKNFDLYDVRKELEKNNIEDDEIRIIVRLLDNEIQRRLLQGAHRDKSKEIIGIGAVLTLGVLAFTIGTFTGILNTGDSFLIVYGPVVAGILILVGGFSLRKKLGWNEGCAALSGIMLHLLLSFCGIMTIVLN